MKMSRPSLPSRVPQLTRRDSKSTMYPNSFDSTAVALLFEICKAAMFLEMAGGNLETAVEIYMSNQGGAKAFQKDSEVSPPIY